MSSNGAHDFVLMYYRASSSVVPLYQYLKELCLFWNLEYRKYTVFRSFLLHALTYWAEILHTTLFQCTAEQVHVLSLCDNFWWSYAYLWTKNIGNTQFSALFSYMLWHIELKFCTWVCFNVLQIKFMCCHSASLWLSVRPSFLWTCLYMHWELSWNFKFDFGFFNAFSFRKVLYKKNLLKCSWRAYYAPFAVLRYV